LIRLFRSYFQERGSALNLAILRVLTCVVLLVKAPTIQFVTTLPATLPFPPIGFGWVVNLTTTNPVVVGSLWVVFMVAAICGVLGLWSRASLWVVGVLSVYVLGLKYCFIKVDHDLIHLPYAALLLATSRCGDVLSIDWLRRRGGDWIWFRADARATSNDYALPLRYLWLLISFGYFFAGFWKVAVSGVDWALSDNLRNTLWGCWACLDDFHPLFRLDRYPLLCRFAALGTLAYELGFVFALPIRRLRPWLCVLGFCFHTGIARILGLDFWPLMVFYPTLIDWGQLLAPGDAPVAVPASNRVLHCLGKGLAVGVALAGLSHFNSWPFSVMPTFAEMAPTAAPIIRVTARTGDHRSVIPTKRLNAYFTHESGWQVYQYYMVCAEVEHREELCRHLRDLLIPKLGVLCDEIEIEQCLFHIDPDRRGESPLRVAPYASWQNAPGARIRVSDALLPLEQYFPLGYRLAFSSAPFGTKLEFAVRRVLRFPERHGTNKQLE
jgi:hypothetical protein